MNVRASWLVSTALALSFVPTTLHAQLGDWTFRGTGEFGIFFSTRDLGKSVGDIPELPALQIKGRMDPAPVFGGGIEAESADTRLLLRAVVRSTMGGTASSQIALCSLTTGELCVPRVVDVRMTTFTGEVVFVQGSAEDRLRHSFVLGAGLRSYDFTAEACDPDSSNPDVFVVCELATDLYQDQAKVQTFIQFGFGFAWTSASGAITAFARVNDVVGKYNGGSDRSDGDFQNDVFGMGGLSFRVR